jgi:hypothetical protein
LVFGRPTERTIGSIVRREIAHFFYELWRVRTRRTERQRRSARAGPKGGQCEARSSRRSRGRGSYKIRVNAICPGIIETPLFRASYESAPDPEAELRKILDRYVIKRAGRPDEIAYAALYLTSGESGYTTGTALAVDGGRMFH